MRTMEDLKGPPNSTNPITVPLSPGCGPSRDWLRMNNPSTRPGDAVGAGTADLLSRLDTIPTAHTPVYTDNMRPLSTGVPNIVILEPAPTTPVTTPSRKMKNSRLAPPTDRVMRRSSSSIEF